MDTFDKWDILIKNAPGFEQNMEMENETDKKKYRFFSKQSLQLFLEKINKTFYDKYSQYEWHEERRPSWQDGYLTTDVFMFKKSSKLFFLILPLAVAKIIFKSLNSDLSSGKGIIELIDW